MHALLLACALAAPPDKVPATLDERIAAALKNHPDIKAAEAKKLLAEAELEQAKLAITQRVSAATSRVELATAKLMQAEADVVVYKRLETLPVATDLEKAQYAKAVPALATARAELAAAELDLQQLIGPAVKAEAKPADKPELSAAKLPSGPGVEKMEAAVLMTVKLDFKGMDRTKAIEGLFAAVKIDPASVRGLKELTATNANPSKLDLVGEQTFAGWVQLLLDDYNGQIARGSSRAQLGVYAREYGLLIEYVQNAPKDAMTLTEFSRAVRAKPR
jgi:hypothetical protein